MCTEAIVGGTFCATQGQLCDALNLDALILHDGYLPSARNPADCLCPVDHEATAAKAGRMLVRHGYQSREYLGEVEYLGMRHVTRFIEVAR